MIQITALAFQVSKEFRKSFSPCEKDFERGSKDPPQDQLPQIEKKIMMNSI